MQAHKHAEVIKAWADGAQVQVQMSPGRWSDVAEPNFNPANEYRIKPSETERVYPVTAMTNTQLSHAFDPSAWFAPDQMDNLRKAVNAALRHACDYGTVVTRQEFKAVAEEAKCATNSLIAAGFTYRGGELWKPPLGNAYTNRNARDMAVAKAVRHKCYTASQRAIGRLDLAEIVTGVAE